MRTLAIIVASIVSPALLPLVIVGAMARNAEPLEPPSGRPTALHWADRLFVSKPEFAAWLESRGVTYQQWVDRHPGASPWERRAAPVRPAKPAAARGKAASTDRRATDDPSLGERLRSLLDDARSALLPMTVVLLVGVVLALLARSRRAVGAIAASALRTIRTRLRGAEPPPGALAGLAGKAPPLPWRLRAAARDGGSRLAGAGARPGTAAGTPRLSLALEPMPAVGAPHDGASRSRTRDVSPAAPRLRPLRLEPPVSAHAPALGEVAEVPECEFAREAVPVAAEPGLEVPAAAVADMAQPVRPEPVEPMEPSRVRPAVPVAVEQMRVQPEPVASAAPVPMAEADRAAEPAASDRASDAPRVRAVFRPVERAVTPVARLQRWSSPIRRPLRAHPSAPVAPEPVPTPAIVPKQEPEPPAPPAAATEPAPAAGDEARELVALVREVAVAAKQEQEPESPNALSLDDQAITCTIAVWHGYVRSRFYARICTPDGETHTVAESPMFRRRSDVPEQLPDAVKAHEALLDRLGADGWMPVGNLGAWYAICLQPRAPGLVSIPH